MDQSIEHVTLGGGTSHLHIHVCKEALKEGSQYAIAVSNRHTGERIAQAREVLLSSTWRVRVYDQPQPCGASVVIEHVNA